MIKYLVVLLDSASISFCHYPGRTDEESESFPMRPEILEQILQYADENGISLNVIHGTKRASDELEALLAKAKRIVRFVPQAEAQSEAPANGEIIVIDRIDGDSLNELNNSASRNLVLRLKKESIGDLSRVISSLSLKGKRINLCLLDLQTYSKEDLYSYQSQLQMVSDFITGEYMNGHPLELSFLTDRIFLDWMNNCNAGIDHVTIAPNGKFYICPGFYYDDDGNSIGDLGRGIRIQNEQLLRIDHAPICSACDAFHCKRCVYLNKKATLEINTPSYQQCAVSHLERDFSRRIGQACSDIEPFSGLAKIEELDYLDPLLLLTRAVKKNHPPEKIARDRSGNGKNADDKIARRTETSVKSNHVTAIDGNKEVKLPRLSRVRPDPHLAKMDGNRSNAKLDTESIRPLLLQILELQKEILEALKSKI